MYAREQNVGGPTVEELIQQIQTDRTFDEIRTEIRNIAGVNGAVLLTSTDPAVAATTTEVLADNTAREYASFQNDSDEVIYLKIGGAAVLNEGIRLNAAGGSFEMSRKIGNLDVRVVNAICASGSKELLVMEGV